MPITGWLADRVGRKRLLLISVVGFTIASVLCALGRILTEMVLFRALQGVSGAFMVPLAQATLFDINPREKHGQAMALFGGGVMIGPILGPVLGGWLTDSFNWRWVFLVNLPVGVVCAFADASLHAEAPRRRGAISTCSASPCSRSRLARCRCSSTAASSRTGSKAGKSSSSSASPLPAAWMFVVHIADGARARCSSGRCSPTAISRPGCCSWR